MQVNKDFVDEITTETFETTGTEFLNNGNRIMNYEGPLLVFHGRDDHIVPLKQGEDLYNACKSEKKELCIFEFGRHSVSLWNSEEYYSRLVKFLNTIFPPEIPITPNEVPEPATSYCTIQ